ncbi:MAG: malate synthase A [Planctomycetes bacterium]|nr:malate synthase A [Planctomycetota bacterium]
MSSLLRPSTPNPASLPSGVELLAPVPPGCEAILGAPALAFVRDLERRFRFRRAQLLARREALKRQLDLGWRPDFLAETRAIRDSAWSVAPVPSELLDRRTEITGPVDRKMVVNALNSGAQVFMADFEDANAPTWENCVRGQLNLFDAIRRQVDFTEPASGKSYRLNAKTAVLFARPRGWHLDEKHVRVDGRVISASLFDFGLYFFHNAHELVARGSGPYFYLPKLENHLEARLWNEVFELAQDTLGVTHGTLKATVLIETILAAFEMNEILWELREHSAGLNCGRWDYIFSCIKKLRADPACVFPDRATVGMDRPFLSAYSQLLVQTCHRRGVHAMGGMAAQIPIKDDPEKNAAALAKVRADKEREVRSGHDGTWVAHPALVPIALEAFAGLNGPNQLHVKREDVRVSAQDLLEVPRGAITEAGLRQNLAVGVAYLEAWLRGVGCVPLHDLMEDAATAEISRVQVWQWLRHGARLADGRTVDVALVRTTLGEEMERLRAWVGPERWAAGRFEAAAALFERLSTQSELEDFLTIPAYAQL